MSIHLFQVTPDGIMSLSTLELSPVIQNKGKQLKCQAQSPVIDHSPLVDSRKLVIHCKLARYWVGHTL